MAAIVFFGTVAAVPTVPAARRGARVQACGDARAACLSERSRACMESDAPAAGQRPRARPSACALGRDRGTGLAGRRDRETVAGVAPRMLMYGRMSDPYAYGWRRMLVSVKKEGPYCKIVHTHTICKLRTSFRRVTYGLASTGGDGSAVGTDQ